MADGADILGAWMAHYLAERMDQAAAAPAGEEGAAARSECFDLILRLWERRYQSPLSRRLEELATALQALIDLPEAPRGPSEGPEDPWVSLRRRLSELHEEEIRICLEGWTAGLDLSQEREDLVDHSDHLSEEEREFLPRLIQLHDALTEVHSAPRSEGSPDLTGLSESERMEWARAQLQALSKVRAEVIGR
jgi:hypothetical protein